MKCTHGKMTNAERDILHEVIIYEGCVSLEVHKNHDDEYYLFKSVKLDDPSINTTREVIVRNFIMEPTEFLHHACIHL